MFGWGGTYAHPLVCFYHSGNMDAFLIGHSENDAVFLLCLSSLEKVDYNDLPQQAAACLLLQHVLCWSCCCCMYCYGLVVVVCSVLELLLLLYCVGPVVAVCTVGPSMSWYVNSDTKWTIPEEELVEDSSGRVRRRAVFDEDDSGMDDSSGDVGDDDEDDEEEEGTTRTGAMDASQDVKRTKLVQYVLLHG